MKGKSMRRSLGLIVAGAMAALTLSIAVQPAFAADLMGVTVDRQATLSAGGTRVVVSGFVQGFVSPVAPLTFSFVTVKLTQVKGNTVISGTGAAFFTANGDVQSWSALLDAPLGASFAPGQATVEVRAYVSDNLGSEQQTIFAKVRLAN